MSESLRPPLFTRRRVLGIGAFAALMVGILVVWPRYRDWRTARNLAELDRLAAPWLVQVHEVVPRVKARLAPIAELAGESTAGCPSPVTGALPVVERTVLRRAIDPGAPQADHLVSSRVFRDVSYPVPYKGNYDKLPDEVAGLRALLAAPYVVIVAISDAQPMRHTGTSTFEGGTMAGTLFVVDVAAAKVACSAKFASQPDFVVAVGEDVPGAGVTADFSRPESAAILTAYHTTVDAQLARIAPGATFAP